MKKKDADVKKMREEFYAWAETKKKLEKEKLDEPGQKHIMEIEAELEEHLKNKPKEVITIPGGKVTDGRVLEALDEVASQLIDGNYRDQVSIKEPTSSVPSLLLVMNDLSQEFHFVVESANTQRTNSLKKQMYEATMDLYPKLLQEREEEIRALKTENEQLKTQVASLEDAEDENLGKLIEEAAISSSPSREGQRPFFPPPRHPTPNRMTSYGNQSRIMATPNRTTSYGNQRAVEINQEHAAAAATNHESAQNKAEFSFFQNVFDIGGQITLGPSPGRTMKPQDGDDDDE